jgi:hypothetical protein
MGAKRLAISSRPSWKWMEKWGVSMVFHFKEGSSQVAASQNEKLKIKNAKMQFKIKKYLNFNN